MAEAKISKIAEPLREYACSRRGIHVVIIVNRNYGKVRLRISSPRANIWRVGVGSSSVEPPRYRSRNEGQTEVNAESSAQDRPTGSH